MEQHEESNTSPSMDEMLADIRRTQWHPTPTR